MCEGPRLGLRGAQLKESRLFLVFLVNISLILMAVEWRFFFAKRRITNASFTPVTLIYSCGTGCSSNVKKELAYRKSFRDFIFRFLAGVAIKKDY